ncbi:MAG TPA: hypothetical protein VK002_11765 [Rubricoccaceae bacterium]|nr:hypothetical protein [Rubricoccaceae bacterium]
MTEHVVPALDERRPLLGPAIVCLALALTGLPYLVLGSMGLYVVVYPVATAIIAVALYAVSRPAYVGFSMWVWFLTPLVRRLVDYGLGGYTESSPAMLAPYLVGGIGALGLWAVLTTEARGARQAFTLMLVALVYGGAVGFVQNSASKLAESAFEWGIPLVTGALVLVDWQQYPRYRDVILRTVTLGMGLLGLYGIYQFFVLPPWDRMWMESVHMISLGQPLPLQVRVFGTLNSPNPFAMTMVVGLLCLLASGNRSRVEALVARLATVPAAFALLLSTVRSGWGAYVVGLLYILFMARSQHRWRVLLFIAVMAAAVAPLALDESVSGRLSDRAASFTDLSSDRSLNARADLYSMAATQLLYIPLGLGLGMPNLDSGLIETVATLGWAGAAAYFLGFALLCLWAWRMRRRVPDHDPFIVVAMGIAVAMTATLPFGNSFTGVKGVYLFGFLALALAGIRYHAAALVRGPVVASG